MHEDDLLAETTAAEIDVSNSVMVNAAANRILSQSGYEVETLMEEVEKENNATLVGCNEVNKNKMNSTEEEKMNEEHAAEDVETGLGAAEERGGVDEYDDCDGDDNGDDDDDDDDDDYDDDDDDGDDDIVDEDIDDSDDYDNDFDEGDDCDDYDDYDIEKDDMMEEKEIDEKEKVENNDNTVEESGDTERNTMEEGKKEEKAREENEGREGESLKKKVKTLRKGNERKKTGVSDKVASKSKDKQEEDGRGDTMEKEDEKNAKEDIEGKEGSSKQQVKKLSKGNRSKVTAGGSEKMASRQDDKLGSSQRKKFSKKVESRGMIFMCSSRTKRDCYHYKVLGLPANKRDVVGKIYKGMRLFLYDIDLKLMYGIYKAAGPGGYNIQPKAFNSQFPSQVRFSVLKDCLPLAEEKFKKVIKDNYFTRTKFDCLLTSQQVKNLCKLFVAASKGSKSKRLAGRVKTRTSTDQDRSRMRGEERPSAKYEKCRYHERSHKRKREVVASPVASVPRLLLPPAAATPSYSYDRTLEMDAYRRDQLVEHLDSHRHPVLEPRDAYRRDPLSDHGASYRRDVAMEHRDFRSRDEIGRRDSYISYTERPEHHDLRSQDGFGRHDPYFSYRGSSQDHDLRSQDEIGRRDRYIPYRERPEHHDLRSQDDFGRRDLYFSYRGNSEDHDLGTRDEIGRRDRVISYSERPAYNNHVYGTGMLPEHDHYRPISRSREYRSAVAPLPEYSSARRRYQY